MYCPLFLTLSWKLFRLGSPLRLWLKIYSLVQQPSWLLSILSQKEIRSQAKKLHHYEHLCCCWFSFITLGFFGEAVCPWISGIGEGDTLQLERCISWREQLLEGSWGTRPSFTATWGESLWDRNQGANIQPPYPNPSSDIKEKDGKERKNDGTNPQRSVRQWKLGGGQTNILQAHWKKEVDVIPKTLGIRLQNTAVLIHFKPL